MGVSAIPIITLITFFVGVLIALQGAYGLPPFGRDAIGRRPGGDFDYPGTGSACGRDCGDWALGSSFAAEIGAMRVKRGIGRT